MNRDQHKAFNQAFDATMRPKPETKIDELVAHFSNTDACKAFFSDNDKDMQRDVLKALQHSDHPLAKTTIKNLLVYGGKLGSPLHFDVGGYTAELIGLLNEADRKEVLCKSWMIASLCRNGYGQSHLHDKKLREWIESYEPEDRLDILCADSALNFLLNWGQRPDHPDMWNRPKVMEWFMDQDEQGKSRMLSTPEGAWGFMSAYGKKGVALVNQYIPREKQEKIFSTTQSILLLYLSESVAGAFLRSVSPDFREQFFESERYYSIQGKGGMSGPELRKKLAL